MNLSNQIFDQHIKRYSPGRNFIKSSISYIVFYILFFLFCSGGLYAQLQTEKPWAYWWWMGSAVTKDGITYQLENLSNAGLGGVHIIPIYGVKGYEKKFIPFLSKDWMGMLHFTIDEAKRLDMGVDMTTGTGWPFGGPQITADIAGKKYVIKNGKFVTELTGQRVKRAAPGGEGLVMDFFSKDALFHYLARFDSAFENSQVKPRSMYCDSYEAHAANWTNNFLKEFNKRRGYNLQSELKLFQDTTNNKNAVLIKMDYQQTLSELLYENFAVEWTKWCKSQGFLSRYQAHGSPGNLLDLYALSDIPETESFGSSRFPIPGLRIQKINTKPNPLFMKFASSAAHFAGKHLVASETATWLAEHFKVSLSQVKPQVDELFAAGINNIFYHGVTYSPKNEPYPGWLFYASTNFGIQSSFWKQLPLLNQYIQRCQHLLQNSQPDNDVLVYFPMDDLWAMPVTSSSGIHQLTAHNIGEWLLPTSFGQICQNLQKEGFTFDYVSDKQLYQLDVDKAGQLSSGHTVYKVLLVPACNYMNENTLSRLIILAKQGAKIIFADHLPQQVSGFYQNAERNKKFKKHTEDLKNFPKNIFITKKWRETLNRCGIKQEGFAKNGLRFIRKIYQNNLVYFVTNLKNDFREGWISLSASSNNVKQYDPVADTSWYVPVRTNHYKQTEIFLTLLPGQSCFLLCDNKKKKIVDFDPKPYNSFILKGDWSIDFIEGKPKLPASAVIHKMVSWTELPDSAGYFSGTAKYSLKFDLPDSVLDKQNYILDLGEVRELADVKLNGTDIGTAWCIPFQLVINKGLLKRKDNDLEVEVTNLAANYMRLRDRQPPEWKKFYDINFVNIDYKPFSTKDWTPMPSGLITNVEILYK